MPTPPTTNNVQVHKAGSTSILVRSLVLYVNKEIPVDLSLSSTKKLYTEDASKIVDALMSALPGGTMDRVCAELARRYACDLRLRLGDVK